MFIRTPDGWVTAAWTHLPMVSAPFAGFTWAHARRLAAQKGADDTNETEVARVLDDLLTRAQAGPDKRSGRVAARTRAGAAAHRPPQPSQGGEPQADDSNAGRDDADEKLAPLIPFGIFDANAEATRW